jgi:hypothetical protein
MKQLIMNALKGMSTGQINLESESARKSVANTIVAAMKTNKKGWFLDLGSIDGKPKLTEEELETLESDDMPEGLKRAKELSQEAIVEGMRRTKNDMQLEHENKVFDKDEEEDEPINTYFTADVKDKRDLEDQEDGDDVAKALGHMNEEGNFITQAEEVDGMYFDDEVKEWEEAVKETETLVDKSLEDYERNKLSEEIVDDSDKTFIYESPDSGKTIYRRDLDSDERVEIKIEEMGK